MHHSYGVLHTSSACRRIIRQQPSLCMIVHLQTASWFAHWPMSLCFVSLRATFKPSVPSTIPSSAFLFLPLALSIGCLADQGQWTSRLCLPVTYCCLVPCRLPPCLSTFQQSLPEHRQAASHHADLAWGSVLCHHHPAIILHPSLEIEM